MLDVIQKLGELDNQRGVHLVEDFLRPPTFLPYAEFPARVAAYAEHFRARGIQRGEHVILPFETSEGAFFSLFGLMEVGAIPLSVKPYILSTPKQSYREFLGRISERYQARRVVDVPSLGGVELSLHRVPLPPAGAKVAGAHLREVDSEELAFVQFSSGSTSFPKGVPITQRNLRANLRMILQHDGRTAERSRGDVAAALPRHGADRPADVRGHGRTMPIWPSRPLPHGSDGLPGVHVRAPRHPRRSFPTSRSTTR